jgi:hypothetical protein
MSSSPSKETEPTVPNSVSRVLTKEIGEHYTFLAKNRHERLKFVNRFSPTGRKNCHGYWTSIENFNAWMSLPEKDRNKNPPPEASVRLFGELSGTFLSNYGDAVEKTGDVSSSLCV